MMENKGFEENCKICGVAINLENYGIGGEGVVICEECFPNFEFHDYIVGVECPNCKRIEIKKIEVYVDDGGEPFDMCICRCGHEVILI